MVPVAACREPAHTPDSLLHAPDRSQEIPIRLALAAAFCRSHTDGFLEQRLPLGIAISGRSPASAM